ncbi:MAG: hypothetical protein KAY37_16795 [Phycisphaerae bacterium]|nr:hypothetical protein [Phycisphaerae bacterium]
MVSSKLNTKGVEVVTVTALQIQQDGTVQILSGVIEGVGIDKMVTLRDPRRPHPSSVGNEPTPEQILAIEAQVAARVDIHDPMQVSPEHFGNQRVEDLPAGYGMPHVTLMSYGSVHCWNIGPNMTFCVGTNADGKAILIIIYCKNEEGKWYRCFYWSDDDEQSGVGN